jgi:hypothetical protein
VLDVKPPHPLNEVRAWDVVNIDVDAPRERCQSLRLTITPSEIVSVTGDDN